MSVGKERRERERERRENTYKILCSDIKARVKALNTGGTTALGPSLALCVGMASNFPSGEIILCTDGVSNVGVGNLEDGRSDSSFYTTVSHTKQILLSSISLVECMTYQSCFLSLHSYIYNMKEN